MEGGGGGGQAAGGGEEDDWEEGEDWEEENGEDWKEEEGADCGDASGGEEVDEGEEDNTVIVQVGSGKEPNKDNPEEMIIADRLDDTQSVLEDQFDKENRAGDVAEELEEDVISGDELMLVPNITLINLMKEQEKQEEPAESLGTVVEAPEEDDNEDTSEDVKDVGEVMEQRVRAGMEKLVNPLESLSSYLLSHPQVNTSGWDSEIKTKIKTIPNGWQLVSV